MNNGILQATIAYKRALDGTPLDVNDRPTSESGRRQAIALLEGFPNPNPTLYEVELYFSAGGFVEGEATSRVDFDACPVGNFTLDKDFIVLHPGNLSEVVTAYSTYGWDITGFWDYATISPLSGEAAKITPVTITAMAGQYGQGYINFKERSTGEIKRVYIIHTDALGWVLETGDWNNLRFWQYNGIWNY